MATTAKPTRLRRSLGFWALVVYGVGDILGAGIYALVGKIAGLAGSMSWLAFAIALGAAALTALAYAELGSRFPRSGGESYFCHRAFRSPSVALMIGWFVFCSGIVSMAAVSHAFAGYLLEVFPGTPAGWKHGVMTGFLLALSGINFWGIRQSSWANIVCTIVEVTGLLLVIMVGAFYLAHSAGPPTRPPMDTPGGFGSSILVVQAAALAFFAFIGFEDMVNVAEEVVAPNRNLPVAIVTALLIAGGVYLAVVFVATAVVPPEQLADSNAPLLEVVRRAAPRFPPWLFTLIALFAVANTGLLNCIMGSRLLYGMAQQRLLPAVLGRIHPRTQTPYWSIFAIFIVGTISALSGTLLNLAGTTSVLLLLVFATVNVALLVIKLRTPGQAVGFQVPALAPIVGALTSLVLIGFLPTTSLLTAAGIALAGVVLVLMRRTRTTKTVGQNAPSVG